MGSSPPVGLRLLLYCIAVDIPAAVEDADDLDALVSHTVKRQILTDDQMTDARRYVIARHSRIGMLGEVLPTRFYRIEDTIGRMRIVRCDVRPDFNQVFGGAIRSNDRQHNYAMRRAASNRRFASALTSLMAGRELGPLSIPA